MLRKIMCYACIALCIAMCVALIPMIGSELITKLILACFGIH